MPLDQSKHNTKPRLAVTLTMLCLLLFSVLALLWDVWETVPLALYEFLDYDIAWDWWRSSSRAEQSTYKLICKILLIAFAVIAMMFLIRPTVSWRIRLALRFNTGWKSMAFFTLISTGAIGLYGWFGNWLSADAINQKWLLDYTIGIIAQQILLQWFVNNRLKACIGIKTAVILSGLIFSVMHAPNAGLMILTLPAGLFWCMHYQLRSNMLAILASHWVLGCSAMTFLGNGPLNRLAVGWAYF